MNRKKKDGSYNSLSPYCTIDLTIPSCYFITMQKKKMKEHSREILTVKDGLIRSGIDTEPATKEYIRQRE